MSVVDEIVAEYKEAWRKKMQTRLTVFLAVTCIVVPVILLLIGAAGLAFTTDVVTTTPAPPVITHSRDIWLVPLIGGLFLLVLGVLGVAMLIEDMDK